jgi:hypothetical protein
MEISKDVKDIVHKVWDDEYYQVVNLESVKGVKKDNFIDNQIRDWRLTGLVSTLKDFTTFNKSKFVGTSFRIHEDNATSLLGFFYNIYDVGSRRVIPHSITYGTALMSQDGEYRSHTIKYESLQRIFSAEFKYKEIIDLVDELISDKISQKLVNIEIKPLCSPDYPHMSELLGFIENNRIFHKIYILCWIYDFYAIQGGISENHMNPQYKKIFSQKADIAYFEKICSLIDDESYQYLRLLITSVPLPETYTPHCFPLRIGQKTFPLIINERLNIGDIRFPTWCEIYITQKCSNLSLNYVSPSFPFLGNWFLLYNTDEYSYDGASTIGKYNYSKISSAITKKLKKVDLLTYRENQFQISKDFMKISNQINHAITFANTRLNLSPISLGITGEYVGRTIKDFIEIHKTNDTNHNKNMFEASGYLLKDKIYFDKYLFELIYAFYAANVVAGVIHCDPHTNNMTVYQTFCKVHEPRTELYHINGKLYSFPFNGEHAMLIDYSRAIIRDREVVKRDFSRQVYKDFCHIQNNAFYKTIIAVFPELALKHEKKLKNLVYENFDKAFRIFSGIDSIIACKSLIELLTYAKIFDEKIGKDIIAKLSNIVLYVDKTIVQSFDNFENGDIDWVNCSIIEEFFAEHQIKELGDKKIITLWNDKAKLKNNVNNYDGWGNHISPEIIKEVLVKNNSWDNLNNKQLYDNFIGNLKNTQNFDAKLMGESRELVELEPWMFE